MFLTFWGWLRSDLSVDRDLTADSYLNSTPFGDVYILRPVALSPTFVVTLFS